MMLNQVAYVWNLSHEVTHFDVVQQNPNKTEVVKMTYIHVQQSTHTHTHTHTHTQLTQHCQMKQKQIAGWI